MPDQIEMIRAGVDVALFERFVSSPANSSDTPFDAFRKILWQAACLVDLLPAGDKELAVMLAENLAECLAGEPI